MKKILSMLAVAAVAFTACTTDLTDEVVNNEAVEYSVPLEFAVEQEVSRAFMDDDLNVKFENGDEFGIYIVPADATAAATKNAKGTYNNGVVSADVASFAAGDKVMAYYPYHTQNNDREASDIILSMPHVQTQLAAGTANLKGMPMVSAATELEGSTGGSLLFRPVASVVKFNVFSNDEAYQDAVISTIRLHAEKHENVTGCNYMTGNRTGFDLTTITADSEIEVKMEATIGGATNKFAINTAPTTLQVMYRAHVNCHNNSVKVGGQANPAAVYLCVWPGNYGGKKIDNNNLSFVQVWTDKGYFKINMTDNYEFGRAMIRPFNVGLVKDDNFRTSVGLQYVFEHAHVAGLVTEQMVNEELIVIGSGSENLNMRKPENTAWNAMDHDLNTKTVYVQTLDGKYGAQLEYRFASHNKLKRGDKITISLIGTKQFNYAKKNGTTEPTASANCVLIRDFCVENLLTHTPNCAAEIVTKEKTLAELTDQDIYTDVKIKNLEFVHKGGAFVYGQGSMAGKPELAHDIRAHYATMMQDGSGKAIFALINAKCPWKRDLVGGTVLAPNGVGKVHGVLVNCIDLAYGDMGKYQIRPFDQTSFEMGTELEYALNQLVDWRMDKKTISVGAYTWNGNKAAGGYITGSASVPTPQNKLHGVHGITDGSAVLYTTNLKAMATHFAVTGGNTTTFKNTSYLPGIISGDKNYKEEYKGSNGATVADVKTATRGTALQYYQDVASFYEWDDNGAWTGNTTGLVMEFPATAASGAMGVEFSISPTPYANVNNANPPLLSKYMLKGSLIGFPYLWKVEASTDNGVTWTRCTNAINGTQEFKMLPLVNWNAENTAYTSPFGSIKLANNLEFCPGMTQQKFLLPDGTAGADKVMIKISPASLQLAYPTNGTFKATMDDPTKQCTKDYSYPCAVMLEDLAVTYAK
ncbi:MAG: hypothetical protein J6R13_07695 [Alistipes sp.]|nr:hypothetical protein [Alistipes sp.]